jgi:hypothetical protein
VRADPVGDRRQPRSIHRSHGSSIDESGAAQAPVGVGRRHGTALISHPR